MATTIKKKQQISWTPKQRDIADLAEQGKGFTEIVNMGYSKHMTSRVFAALKEGNKPPPEEGGTEQKDGTEGTRSLISTSVPRQAPIIFRVANREIVLDPLELYRQYSYYEDIMRKDGDGGKPYPFSEVLTMGIQVIWLLKQNIPITENMLRALFYGYK